MFGQPLDRHRSGTGLRPVRRIGDEKVDLLRRLGEGGFGRGGDCVHSYGAPLRYGG